MNLIKFDRVYSQSCQSKTHECCCSVSTIQLINCDAWYSLIRFDNSIKTSLLFRKLIFGKRFFKWRLEKGEKTFNWIEKARKRSCIKKGNAR